MGCNMSKGRSATGTSAATNLHYKSEMSSFEAACNIKAGTSFSMDEEARSLSFGSLMGVAECLMEMNQEVVNFILICKKATWGKHEMFELIEEYFENSLESLDFCAALDKCLTRAKDSQLLVSAALDRFDKDRGSSSDTYSNTSKELKCFRAAGDPFTEEFFVKFQLVYQQQVKMLRKLQQQKYKIDKKLKQFNACRKVSNVIFMSAFAAVLISSVVAVTAAAPPVAAALSAACFVPIGWVGKWVNSLWKNFEEALRRQKIVINSMQVGTYVVIKDMDNIRVLVERLEIGIASMLNSAELASDEVVIKYRIADIRMRLGTFIKNIKNLGSHADVCTLDIRRARTVILQSILKNPDD